MFWVLQFKQTNDQGYLEFRNNIAKFISAITDCLVFGKLFEPKWTLDLLRLSNIKLLIQQQETFCKSWIF